MVCVRVDEFPVGEISERSEWYGPIYSRRDRERPVRAAAQYVCAQGSPAVDPTDVDDLSRDVPYSPRHFAQGRTRFFVFRSCL